MTETWGRWTLCKNKPNLEGFQHTDTNIYRLEYTVVVVDYYDKGRWNTEGKEIRSIKEYTPEEWEKIENGKISKKSNNQKMYQINS